MKIGSLKIDTSESLLKVSDGLILDLTECVNVREVKSKIIDYFIPLCSKRKSAHQYCRSIIKGSGEESCPLQVKFLSNYLEATVRFIPKKSSYHVKRYLEYILYVLKLVDSFNQWQGGVWNKGILKWQGEASFRFDKYWFNDINLALANVISCYSSIEPAEKSYYRYKVFIEGVNDKRALQEVSSKIGSYVFDENLEVLGGEGESKNNIRYITHLIREGTDVFLLLDNEGNWYKHIEKGLISKGVITKDQILKFDKALEDSFSSDTQFKAFGCLLLKSEIKESFPESYFKKKSRVKLVDRIQKDLIKKGINFKDKLKESFNEKLLDEFLKKSELETCELLKMITKLNNLIKKRRKFFYLDA